MPDEGNENQATRSPEIGAIAREPARGTPCAALGRRLVVRQLPGSYSTRWRRKNQTNATTIPTTSAQK
jgi:hypothetical protein